MGRVIVECPSCGIWMGPPDGEASSVVSQYCEDCAKAIALEQARAAAAKARAEETDHAA